MSLMSRNATVDLRPENVKFVPPVERNGYDFSDGVGTISPKLLPRVWRRYGRQRMIKPTALQIRFKGCKGMVSLDERLIGEVLVLRENMLGCSRLLKQDESADV